MPIQPLWDVVKLYPDARNIDHDGLSPFGWYHLHVSPGDSWLEIGGRRWELDVQDVSRPIADGRRPNSRTMTKAWADGQPRPVMRSGFRAFVVGRDGRRATDLYKTDAEIGTRTECGIGYDIRRLSNRRRHLFQRAVLLAELLPAASPAIIKQKAESGWWPEHKHQRPPWMFRPRFNAIQAALRHGPGRAIVRKHVHRGREIWESKLPAPLPLVTVVSSVVGPSAAESFFRQVYGEER